MSTKLKKEELEAVQKSNQKQFEIKNALGELVIAKESFDQRKQSLLKSWGEAIAEQKKLQEDLKEAYGEVTIDIQTGEIMEPAPENVEQDDNKGDS